MASLSGTFTAVQQSTTPLLFLRATETVRTTLTITGSARISLCRSFGPGQAVVPIETYAASGTYDWVNTTGDDYHLLLLCVSVTGSVAYTFADVAGDQILQEWRAADGTLVARITDQGMVFGVGRVVDVRSEGAVGDGVTDDTAAIQRAIDVAGAGGSVVIPDGTYRCSGLTGSAAYQQIIGTGQAILQKNANGAILTHSGERLYLSNLQFWGDAASPVYTGNNLTLTGNHPVLHLCGSRWAYGRAVLATGSHVQIYGTNDIYQTTDASGTGYDIEIGVSGTATLYHELYGIYSSQATGGILLTDTGSHTLVGGQFGKLTIARGTSPSGVNGGKTIGARVLGTTTIQQSSAMFSACQFGAITVTFTAASNYCSFDASNVISVGGSLVNSGDDTNLICQPDANNVPGYLADFAVRNNRSLRWMSQDGSAYASMLMTTANNLQIINPVSGGATQLFAAGALGVVQMVVNSVVKTVASASGLHIGTSISAPFISSGSGAPEGAVTAPIGSLYHRTDGGAGTSLYVKESGTGNTGWVGK